MSNPASSPLPFVVDAFEDIRRRRPDDTLRILDIGCGRGRHVHLFASSDAIVGANSGANSGATGGKSRGTHIVGVDRNEAALAECAADTPAATTILFDVEATPRLPPGLPPFDVIVTTFFLYRPLVPVIAAALAPGGEWWCETFHEENRVQTNHPRRAAFAWGAGEAAMLAKESGLDVVSNDEGKHGETWTTQLIARRPD